VPRPPNYDESEQPGCEREETDMPVFDERLKIGLRGMISVFLVLLIGQLTAA
jgi:hypothetical protein